MDAGGGARFAGITVSNQAGRRIVVSYPGHSEKLPPAGMLRFPGGDVKLGEEPLPPPVVILVRPDVVRIDDQSLGRYARETVSSDPVVVAVEGTRRIDLHAFEPALEQVTLLGRRLVIQVKG